MRVAIMQPYLFPYLGYFQLIQSVDAFVIYDDVNYIKGGWVNRNFIIANKGKQLVTLPVEGASPNKLINQITVGSRRRKFIETIRQRYSQAPQFSDVMPLIEDIVLHAQENLALFLDYALRRICSYFGLQKDWYISSSLDKDATLRGQDKVLAVCEELGANHYHNAPGGMNLYDREMFAQRGIQLAFVQPNTMSYSQFGDDFVPNLSIIDVMMFNNLEQCKTLLKEYTLV